MSFTHLKLTVAVAALAVTVPSFAQDAADWTGGYIGGRVGYAWQPNHNSETVLFDRNLDGAFGDTVTTAAGANAFSPGFCGGAAITTAPTGGCTKDKDGIDWAVHAGYDYQMGSGFVIGAVAEYGNTRGRDAVSAFSTTPAQYTLTRSLRDSYGIRARAGAAFGQSLAYATGGVVWGKVKNRFTTSNTANAFTTTGNDTVNGYRLGAGFEHKLGANFSLGLEYLYTRYNDNDYRVRAGNSGTTAATNPFLLGNASGTDFRRSATHLTTSSLGLTANYRF